MGFFKKLFGKKHVVQPNRKRPLTDRAADLLIEIIHEGQGRYYNIEKAAGLVDGKDYSDAELMGKLAALLVLAHRVKDAIGNEKLPVAATSKILAGILERKLEGEAMEKHVRENCAMAEAQNKTEEATAAFGAKPPSNPSMLN
jgi:hypothetical protein